MRARRAEPPGGREAAVRGAKRGGSATTEMALVLPVLLGVIFSVIDWSWYMYQWLSVTDAVERGARRGAGITLADGPIGIATTATTDALQGNGLDGTGITVTAWIETRPAGKVLVVRVAQPFTPLVGLSVTPSALHAEASVEWYGDFGRG